ncbi:MAG: hypothetical protein ACQEVA_08600 [Myxococcota bacterium]
MSRVDQNESCAWMAAIWMVTLAICTGLVVMSPASVAAQEEEPDSDEEESTFSEEELFEDEEEETRRSDQLDTFERRRVNEKPLSSMTVEEAREAGFVFGSEREESSRTSATLLAATAGLVVHGTGHWVIEEQRTAGILLATELVGLSLVGSALGWQALSNGSPASRIYAGPAMFAGAGIFAASYLADIMGTVQSVEIGLPQNDGERSGISGRAAYSFVRLDGYPGSTLQLLTVGADADLGFGFAQLETAQDIYLDTSKYGADVAWRFWRGPGRHNFVYLEASGDMLQFRGVGPFTRYGFAAKLGVSFDVGQMISQLRHLVVGTSIGWGRHWYQLPEGGEDELGGAYASDSIPYEIFMSLNLNDKLNARLSYERRDGAFLQSDSRLLGMVAAELTFRSGDRADLLLRADAGGGYGLTAGLRLWFWE